MQPRPYDGRGSSKLKTFTDETPAELSPPEYNHRVEKLSEPHKIVHKSQIVFCEMPILLWYPSLWCPPKHICQELPRNERILTGSNVPCGSFTWEPRQDGSTRSKPREVSWPTGRPYNRSQRIHVIQLSTRNVVGSINQTSGNSRDAPDSK